MLLLFPFGYHYCERSCCIAVVVMTVYTTVAWTVSVVVTALAIRRVNVVTAVTAIFSGM